MSRRRSFEIAAPEGEAAAPAAPTPRRGPMAAAVRETGAALAERARAEAAIRAENDRLAEAHVAARRSGLVLEAVDPDAIEAHWLHRDRAPRRDEEIDALKTSIREVGLSNPIRLAPLGEGRYALVQGWRRLSAWRELRAETGDPAFDRIPAAVGPAAAEEGEDGLTRAYRRMVDENLVRRDVSFAEMANLARAYADEHGLDAEAAVDVLFRSAPAQKRSYIRAFVELMEMMEHTLEHPAAIPRGLGLDLRRRLAERPESAPELYAALRAKPGRNADAELAILRGFAAEADLSPRRNPATPRTSPALSRRTVRVRLEDHEAELHGRTVAIRMARDLSGVGPERLRAALAAFVATVNGES